MYFDAHFKILLLLALGMATATTAGVFLFRRAWRAPSKLRAAAINLALLVASLSGLALALECYFSQWAIQSEGFALTLSSKRWLQTHYQWNSLGHRDAEPTPESFAGKRTLFVVGDSFAAGAGIPNQADRFSDQLAARLGPGWRVANIAVGGWHTVQELAALKAYPHKPDAVLLSYYVNDIQHAIEARGLEYIPPFPQPPRVLRPLVDRSYLANTIYWRIQRVKARLVKESYWDNLKRYYADPAIWKDHADALAEFANYCHGNGIALYAVIFPNLLAVEESAPITRRVAQHFTGLEVPVLDLTPALSGRPAAELVVSNVNSHPNEDVHRQTANLLRELLEEHAGTSIAANP